MSQQVMNSSKKISSKPKNASNKSNNHSNKEVIDPTEANKSVQTLMKEFPNLTNGIISTALQLSNNELPKIRIKATNGNNDALGWESVGNKNKNNKNKNKTGTNSSNKPTISIEPSNSSNQSKIEKNQKINKNSPNEKRNNDIDEITSILQDVKLLDVSNEHGSVISQTFVDNLVNLKDKLVKEQSEEFNKYKNKFYQIRQIINDLEILVCKNGGQNTAKKIELINESIASLSNNSGNNKELKSIYDKTINTIKNCDKRFDQNLEDTLKKLQDLLENTKDTTETTSANNKKEQATNLDLYKSSFSPYENIQNNHSNYNSLNSNASKSPVLIRTSISPQASPRNEHVPSKTINSPNSNDVKNFKPEFDGVLINPHDMMKKMLTQKLGQQSFLPLDKKNSADRSEKNNKNIKDDKKSQPIETKLPKTNSTINDSKSKLNKKPITNLVKN